MSNEIKGLVNISTGVGISDADARYTLLSTTADITSGLHPITAHVTSATIFNAVDAQIDIRATGAEGSFNGVQGTSLYSGVGGSLTSFSLNGGFFQASDYTSTISTQSNVVGVVGYAKAGSPTGATRLINQMTGGQLLASVTGPGTTTVTQLIGGDIGTPCAASTITTLMGLRVDTTTSNVATITNRYGIRQIDALAINSFDGLISAPKLTLRGSSSGSASIKVAATAGTPADLILPTTSGTNGQILSTNGSGNLSWTNPTSAGGGGQLWGKISDSTTNPITGTSSTPLLNRVNMIVSGPTDYNIDISSLGQAAGDVIAFIVKEYAVAPCFYTLDAGVGHKIAGRTRYLSLLHTNVVLLEYDGTDWQPLVLNLDTPFVEIGLITYMGGDTTNPTFNAGAISKLRYRRVGNVQEMHGNLYQTTGGSSAGSGRYFLNLWRGQVDTNLCLTLSPNDSLVPYAAAYAIGEGDINDGTSTNAQLQPIIDSSNHIYFAALAYGIGYHYWSDSWFHATGQLYGNFRIYIPMLNW